MTVDQLQCVRAVASAGSFTRAAASLLVSQPALSMQIRSLERELGERLFHRGGGAIVPTASGRAVLGHAQAILAEVEKLKAGMKARRGLEEGELNLAAGDAVLRHLLLPSLSRFAKKHPGVRLRVWNKTSSETCALIQEGRVDLGVVTLPAKARGLEIKVWRAFRQVAVSASARSGAPPRAMALTDLCAQNLLLLERGTRGREALEASFFQRGLAPTSVMDLGSVDAQIDLARIGVGVAVVPDFSVRGAAGLACRPIGGLPAAHLALATRKGPVSRLAEAFRAALLEGGATR